MQKNEVEARLLEIEALMASPSFWSDKDAAQAVLKEYQDLKGRGSGGSDATNGAIVTIISGAGGDDAEDFTRILFAMYQKYAALQGWKTGLIDSNENSMGGFRSISFEVMGAGSYGALKHEAGVHRLVRMSPFNSAGKRQTSFSLVEVLPKLPDQGDLHIPESELDISFARSGGPGGQNVNKRDTAVHATHLPTGLHVHVTSERSQAQNKEKAIEMLRGKLYKMREEEVRAKERGLSLGSSTKIEWGSQIRSYVLHPYQLVKDHRTEHERRDVEAVLDGDIQSFIDAEKDFDSSTGVVQ